MLEQECGDAQKAVDALVRSEAALAGDTGVLTRLERLFTSLRQWPKLIAVLDQLYRAATEPTTRGAYRFAQADVVLGRLREEPRGLAFLELALDEDPQNDRALSALIAVRTRREEWAELAAVYERLIDRFAGLGDRERAWEVCRKLGVLRRDRLLDGPGAIEALRGAVEVRADDVESRAALAELYAAKGDRTVAVSELETVAAYAPMRAQTYRRLHDLHSRAQRPDRAWLTATCLEELGAADVSHELVIEQFRPDGPIRPTTALEDGWWDECLRAPGADPIVCDILRAVSATAIALRLEELAATKKLPTLDPATKQDKASTASVVRTFVWAARALGIESPDLYLLDDVPSGIAAVPAQTPGTALGPQVRSGMTVQQLAFLTGRHLTYYRPEHYALVFFPTLADVSSLVLAVGAPRDPRHHGASAGGRREQGGREPRLASPRRREDGGRGRRRAPRRTRRQARSPRVDPPRRADGFARGAPARGRSARADALDEGGVARDRRALRRDEARRPARVLRLGRVRQAARAHGRRDPQLVARDALRLGAVGADVDAFSRARVVTGCAHFVSASLPAAPMRPVALSIATVGDWIARD